MIVTIEHKLRPTAIEHAHEMRGVLETPARRGQIA